MTKPADRSSASRIWRTVVFSGAMLGAPLMASAEIAPETKPVMKKAPEPATPTPPPVQEADTVASVTQLIADMDLRIKAAMEAATAAKVAADEAVKKAKQAAIDEAAKVTVLRKEKGALDKRLRLAKAAEDKAKRDAAAKPRPRTLDQTVVRPRGRGFVLA